MRETISKKQVKLDYQPSLILLAVGLILFLVFGSWLVIQINRTTTQIQQERARLAALDRREENYRKLQSDYQSIKDRLSIIDRALPDQDSFVASIVFLEREARNRKVGIEINFSDQPEISDNLLSFNLKVSGKQNDVLKYLQALKASDYYLEMSSIQLNKAGPQGQVAGEIIIKIAVDETFQPSQISS